MSLSHPRWRQETRTFVIVLSCCLAISLCAAAFLSPLTLDDTYITFHYARNAAAGWALGTWNIGEAPVEGFTSLLWTLLITWSMRLGLSPFVVSKLLGLLCAVAMPLMLFCAYLRSPRVSEHDQFRASQFGSAAILLGLYLPLYYYAVSGMEAAFFSAQVLALVLVPFLFRSLTAQCILAALVSTTLVLTRPEGILVSLILNTYWTYTGRTRQSNRWAIAGLLSCILAAVGLTVFRLHHFGEVLPNTYFAKGTGGNPVFRAFLGVRYVGRFLILIAPAAVVAVFTGPSVWKRLVADPFNRVLVLLLLLYVAYVIKVGGDPDNAFPLRRHFVHIAAIWILLLAGLIAYRTVTFNRALKFSGALALVLLVWVSVISSTRVGREAFHAYGKQGLLKLRPPDPAWAWLDRYSTSDTLVAITGAGEWPYMVPGRYIDMLGLNDRHIAKYGHVEPKTAFQDSKSDMNYVLSRHPDIIGGLISPNGLAPGKCPVELHGNRAHMIQDMLHNESFRDDYMFVTNGPYRTMGNALFFSKEFAAQLHAAELNMVPVSDTPLFDQSCR